MLWTKCLLLSTATVIYRSRETVQAGTCYQRESNSNRLYGSKTSYAAVSGVDLQKPSDCTPIQVWMMSRHGTRYPSRETITEFKTKLNLLKAKITEQSPMCWDDINAIRNWNTNLTIQDHYMLQAQGIEELKTLALRLKRQFPNLFSTNYDASKFKFLSSPKPRATASATVFFQSLFNTNPEKDLPTTKNDDRISLSKCKVIVDDDAMDGSEEVNKFQNSPSVQSVVSSVSMKMGLSNNLTYNDVQLIFESCRYEKAWYPQSSPAWCALFSHNDLEILEYLEDLKYYYSNAYGNPNGERLGCPIVKDMINNFKNIARGQITPSGVFYFGHTPNVLSIVTRMGIAKDNIPLLSSNFEKQRGRNWRTSFIDPFASNFIAVFYKCREGNKVMFLLNEHAIPMTKESCKLCPWEPIENTLNPIISNQSCTLDFCSSFALCPSINTSVIVFIFIFTVLKM
ncbi:multiple inositol polyphosphate phosphatase 1-like [Adelges cooleyi]|uniref:multiple inositol polyphosphate phosphatase 1-like n=1 Tax=Adelges cooleyi TaxID=133065 RepID=UPI00217F33BA|nr:multiple inositol polyphosphate phosphatase 1-like [Adelges cooleyi]